MCFPESILSRFLFDVIDHQHWQRVLLHFEFQPELLRQRIEQGQRTTRILCISCPIRRRSRLSTSLSATTSTATPHGADGTEVQCKVESTFKSRHVLDRRLKVT